MVVRNSSDGHIPAPEKRQGTRSFGRQPDVENSWE